MGIRQGLTKPLTGAQGALRNDMNVAREIADLRALEVRVGHGRVRSQGRTTRW